MTTDDKIKEIRTPFDKIIEEWDIEKLSSPRLVQIARNIEEEIKKVM